MVRGRLLPGHPGGLSMVAFEASLSGLQPCKLRAIRLPLSGSDRFVMCNGLGTYPPGEVSGCIEAAPVRNPTSGRPINALKAYERCMRTAGSVTSTNVA